MWPVIEAVAQPHPIQRGRRAAAPFAHPEVDAVANSAKAKADAGVLATLGQYSVRHA